MSSVFDMKNCEVVSVIFHNIDFIEIMNDLIWFYRTDIGLPRHLGITQSSSLSTNETQFS